MGVHVGGAIYLVFNRAIDTDDTMTVFKKAYLDLKSDIKSGALSLSDSRFFSRNSILHI